MTINPKFDLTTALAKAESGDAALWEDIARHLIAKQPKAKKPRAANNGVQTWAHVVLADGREFLTSAYARKSDAETLAAHGAYAQYRARMEDSGDNGRNRVFLDRSKPVVPVREAILLDDADTVEAVRERCYAQRGMRQGWLHGELQHLFDGIARHCLSMVMDWRRARIEADDAAVRAALASQRRRKPVKAASVPEHAIPFSC